MPDKRQHRGPNPEDHDAFAPKKLPLLRSALADLTWLLTRGYSHRSALKLVGDRHALTERQRTAVMRSACSDQALTDRQAREVNVTALAGNRLLLDGYNVLTTVEAALAGGVVLVGRDGCFRDMASMHGSFKTVQETIPAISLIGETLAGLATGQIHWYLDRPVSNSGRLMNLIQQTAVEHRWDWQVELVQSPDAVLSRTTEIIATADSAVLDRCGRWFNLAREVVTSRVPDAQRINFDDPFSDVSP